MPNTKRMTLEQAAQFLKIQPQELRSLAVENLINYSLQGERYYFSQDDLDVWLSRKIIALQSLKTAAKHREKKLLKLPDASEPFLADLCSVDTIDCALPGRSRPAVLKALTELAVKSECVYDPNDLYNELLEREELAATTIENGAAFPHPHHRFDTPLFDDSFIAIAKTENPVYFGNAPDGKPTDLFFLVCAMDSNLHILIIARLCLLCQNTTLLDELRKAETPEELLQTLKMVDKHPEQFPSRIRQDDDNE